MQTLAVACLGVSLAACQLETSTVEMVEVLHHENGLIVKRPQGFTVQKSEVGFVMTTEEEVRRPMNFHIGIMPEGQQPQVAPSWFGLFGYRYRLVESEGGSGGGTYSLTAMHQLKNCWVVLGASQQAEYGAPSFLEAWAVLDNASAANDLKC